MSVDDFLNGGFMEGSDIEDNEDAEEVCSSVLCISETN